MAAAPDDDDLLARARDAGYTAVGFAVLAFQRLQVQRRELTKELAAELDERIGGKEGVRRIVKEVDKKVDPVLDSLEQRLPDDARRVFRQARVAGRAMERVLLM